MIRHVSLRREDFDLHYRVYGSGTPILLLSGGPGFDCDYMIPVAQEVAKERQAVLVELRGTGRSIPPVIDASTINAAKMVGDLEALRESLRQERWSVLGHSAGAVLAMHYAVRHPQRIAPLVLANSGPITHASVAAQMDNVLCRLAPEERDALKKTPPDNLARMLQILLPAFFFDRAAMPAIENELGGQHLHPDVSRLIGADMMGPGTDLRPQLKDFAAPVLIVAGRQDPLDPVIQEEIHQALKNSSVRLLDRCGHYAWIEQPAEFYSTVREFLRGAEAGA